MLGGPQGVVISKQWAKADTLYSHYSVFFVCCKIIHKILFLTFGIKTQQQQEQQEPLHARSWLLVLLLPWTFFSESWRDGYTSLCVQEKFQKTLSSFSCNCPPHSEAEGLLTSQSMPTGLWKQDATPAGLPEHREPTHAKAGQLPVNILSCAKSQTMFKQWDRSSRNRWGESLPGHWCAPSSVTDP